MIADQRGGFVGKDGYDSETAAWAPPAVVNDADREAAKQYLSDAIALTNPVPKDLARTWLGSLGVLVAGSMPVAEARLRLYAYVDLLDFPVGLVNDGGLKRAGRRFKWFPAYAELAAFVDEESKRLEAQAHRLKAIAHGSSAQAVQPLARCKIRTVAAALRERPAQTQVVELTDGLSRDRLQAYWGARLDGKTPTEARALATESSFEAEDAAE